MMRRTIENSHGHPLENLEILLPSDYLCNIWSQGKLIIKPSSFKDCSFFERIQGNICEPIRYHVGHLGILWF